MYTDDYNDDNEEVKEEVVEKNTNYNYDSGSSRNYLKIVAVVILVLILLGLLYFLFFKGKSGGSGSKEEKYALTVYPESIIVGLGKTQNISYEVRNNGIVVPEAVVRLTVIDENIAKVDNTILTGINYGKTAIMATYVSPDGKSYQDTKEVVVADGNPDTPITNVNFPDGDLQMPFNGTYNLNLGITPNNGYVENKVISSSNNNVVLVDNAGQITAVSEGEAVISIDINNGQFKKDILVFVSRDSEISKLVVSPTDIKISNPIEKIKEGETASLKYTITPSNASTDNIKWTSSNENVLTVDYRGKITALKPGLATIKVTTFNNVTDSISIEVEKSVVEIQSIDLSIADISITAGQSQMIVPIINPADATDKTLLYETSNPTVAMLTPSSDTSTLTIMGLTPGTTTITIKANNTTITKTINVTILEAEPEPSGGGGGGSCASCSKVDCGAGQYCKCGKCVTCPAGNYCYNNKKTACAAGKGSISGSSSYQDCSACAKGYYATGDGKGCVACPVGKTTKGSGSTSKSDCNVDETGGKCKSNEYYDGTKCVGCPKGYTNSGGATSIASCKMTISAGQYLKTGGASKTTACPAGTYSTVTSVNYGNTSSCKPCAKGYYQNKTGQGSCNKCPDGKTTSGTGSKNESACSITVSTPRPTSITCRTNQYKSGSTCVDCTAGYKCNGVTRTKCPAGYISIAKSTSCSRCSTGKSNDARTQCIR